jgi:hypothetical protein
MLNLFSIQKEKTNYFVNSLAGNPEIKTIMTKNDIISPEYECENISYFN